MADCDPERIMCLWNTHVNEIKLYSSQRGITQDLYFKENHFEGSIVCFLG